MRSKIHSNVYMCLMIFGAIMFAPYAFAAPGEFIIALNPVSDNTIEVYVVNARDLGAFEVEVSFDKAKFECTGVEKGTLLQESMRQFNLLGPKIVKDVNGVSFGFFSLGKQKGIDGNGQLALIKYSGDPTSVTIRKITATDSKGDILNSKLTK